MWETSRICILSNCECFNSLDLLRKEGVKGNHGQDHLRQGEREERGMREDTDITHHRHLQRTEDPDPGLL